ncbi:hypothetical protein HZH66_008075 [Vespula vulgaris]|uniref:Uncharacterized protein n=1 Tax=Vespula vulgaris TaxID=7454 RepID=A0A834JWF3_VESVU|nr:hypothetical protein HZH66_008075 [Vespula vulgaris]
METIGTSQPSPHQLSGYSRVVGGKLCGGPTYSGNSSSGSSRTSSSNNSGSASSSFLDVRFIIRNEIQRVYVTPSFEEKQNLDWIDLPSLREYSCCSKFTRLKMEKVSERSELALTRVGMIEAWEDNEIKRLANRLIKSPPLKPNDSETRWSRWAKRFRPSEHSITVLNLAR